MKPFVIDQFAFWVNDSAAARKLLSDMGANAWTEDEVEAEGTVVFDKARNKASLAFNYQLFSNKVECEILDYKDGKNWLNAIRTRKTPSHLGMHCTEEELAEWKNFFAIRGIPVIQEVFTTSHTNPVIARKRFYHYCIFRTFEILGIDLKFIVRRDVEEGNS